MGCDGDVRWRKCWQGWWALCHAGHKLLTPQTDVVSRPIRLIIGPLQSKSRAPPRSSACIPPLWLRFIMVILPSHLVVIALYLGAADDAQGCPPAHGPRAKRLPGTADVIRPTTSPPHGSAGPCGVPRREDEWCERDNGQVRLANGCSGMEIVSAGSKKGTERMGAMWKQRDTPLICRVCASVWVALRFNLALWIHTTCDGCPFSCSGSHELLSDMRSPVRICITCERMRSEDAVWAERSAVEELQRKG